MLYRLLNSIHYNDPKLCQPNRLSFGVGFEIAVQGNQKSRSSSNL